MKAINITLCFNQKSKYIYHQSGDGRIIRKTHQYFIPMIVLSLAGTPSPGIACAGFSPTRLTGEELPVS